jgi:hypothetical protein
LDVIMEVSDNFSGSSLQFAYFETGKHWPRWKEMSLGTLYKRVFSLSRLIAKARSVERFVRYSLAVSWWTSWPEFPRSTFSILYLIHTLSPYFFIPPRHWTSAFSTRHSFRNLWQQHVTAPVV